MTVSNAGSHGPAPARARDSLWLSKALDGDVLVVVEHAGIRSGDVVDVVLSDGRLILRQGQTVYADLAAGEEHERFLSTAPSLIVLEVEYGTVPEEDRFTVHSSARLVGGPNARP